MTRIIFKKLVSVKDAQEKFFNSINYDKLRRTEEIPLTECLNRVAARTLTSPIDVPPFDRARMDGFAVKAKDTFGADEENPIELKIVGEIKAGDYFEGELQEGEAIEISTGAPIPLGADAVVMVEDTQREGDKVWIFKAVTPGTHIMAAGSDINFGEIIIRKGTRLTARELSLAAAVGFDKIPVMAKPKVAVISTGNEVMPAGKPLERGKIYDINTQTIHDSIINAGGEPIIFGIVPDRPKRLEEVLTRAINTCDIVTVSGGTSAGMGDMIHSIIDNLGDPGILVHGIAVQPGKPTILAIAQDKPIIGLPGYPTSALMIFDLFVTPIIQKCLGMQHATARETVTALTPTRIHSARGREQLLLVNLTKTSDNDLIFYPLPGGSGAISTLSRAAGYVRVPANVEFLPANSCHEVHLLIPRDEIPDLTIIGSHCLGLEAIIDEFASHHPHLKVSNTNLGSLGGLAAVRRGEADIAGIHILNEVDGTYNRHVLSEKDRKTLMLIKGYQREQGLIIQKGNPKDITSLSDIISRNDIRFINRNKGSGTRILVDFLISQHARELSVDSNQLIKKINGYSRAVKSHSTLASAIREGQADVGFGIRAVAEAFNLDFIPLVKEEYDFIIRKDRLQKEGVQRFIDILQSHEVKNRLNSMNGFSVPENIGTPLLNDE